MQLPPRVIVIEPDQWMRALARAALRESGYDAVGALDVAHALRQHERAEGRGPVGVVIVDQDAVMAGRALDDLRAALGDAAMILVRRPTRAEPAGPWTTVLARPVSVQQLVDAVQKIHPLPEGARRPLDDAGA